MSDPATSVLPVDWPRLTNTVGRAAARADHNEFAEHAMHHMLDVLEGRPELIDSAQAWVEGIAERGYVAALPWAGWIEPVEPCSDPERQRSC
jgi:hypothetical protein